MSSKIEQVISEIEEYIDGCNFVPLSSTKIIVVKEEIEEMLHELRLKTPEEVKKYQKLLKDKDRIIGEANEQARMILDTAQVQTNELVNEHEIMQRAYGEGQAYIDQAKAEAQKILDAAVEEANSYKQSAVEYTDQLLESMQAIIETTINSAASRYDGLLGDLNSTLNVILSNRSALRPEEEQYTAEEQYENDSDVNYDAE